MHIRVLPVTILAAALSVPPVHAGQPAPWFGTWQLDPARSTQRAEPSPYKKVTIRIEPARDGVKVTYDMVGIRGGVSHMEWGGAMDGRESMMQGVDYVLTNAYRPIDDRSYEIRVRMDGRDVARAVATVARDGRTLTVVTHERDARGQPSTTTAVYDRRE